LDPDLLENPRTKAAYDELFEELKPQFRGGLARVILPGGADPGDLERSFLRNFVAHEAKAQGVQVSWARR
jgi:hypothetical protein